MTIREFEVLLALCKAAPLVQTATSAQKLARQLTPYILDSHTQVFVPSPFFRKVEPSPTEALTFHVTAALLSLGIQHDDVHENVSANIWAYLNACDQATESVISTQGDEDDASLEDAIRTATIAVSLLGFLDAASAQAEFWRSGGRMALIQRLKETLSEPFLTAVETAFSTIRNAHAHERIAKEWKRYMRHYSELGRPLGAMLLQQSFMRLLVAGTSLLVAEVSALRSSHILDLLMSGEGLLRPRTAASGDANFKSVETYASIVIDQMTFLDASADYTRLGSVSQQKLAFGVKAAALISYINCARLNEDAADTETLISWLEDALADHIQMADENLASVVLRSMALICRISPPYSATVCRLLPRFIVQSGAQGHIITTASQSLAYVLQMLSTDAVITTLYTLGNVLSPGGERGLTNGLNGSSAIDGGSSSEIYNGRHSTGSSISLQISGEEDTSHVYGNVVEGICGIASACKDEKISALAQSMLLQKYDKINSLVDARIITGAAVLALNGGQLEFRSLLKLYTRICHDAVVEHKDLILTAVMKARNYISANLRQGSPLYDIYWEHILDSIVSKGDVHQTSHAKESDIELAAREIAQLLQPLAIFMSTNDMASDDWTDDDTHSLLRDAWFNIVVHGFTPGTDRGKKYVDALRIIAVHSPPLVAEQRGEQVESDIELNTVLRRGMSSDRESSIKKQLSTLVPSKASEIRGLSYRKVIFLQTAYLVESLRADSGDCTKVLSYFLEPSMRRGDISSVMEGITGMVVDRYLKKTLNGSHVTFSAQYAASQLASIFTCCCHRIELVQQAAYACADRIVRDVPSALCHRSSLFALLELLSLMWSSCLEAETDLYEPRSVFESARGNVAVELSDDYALRRYTLDRLYKKAKFWVSLVLDLAPADIKGLLQTYLSEFDDEGAYGHISLGRSFALELGNPDPFFLKEEFAPSDIDALAKRKQLVHNLLAPHTRLLQFLASHFNATRLGSPDTQKIFLRLLDLTLDAIKTATSHPMAREIRFQIVLFGLKVLRTTSMGAIAQWRLKDKILSAALSWFSGAPKWSFGSNNLQLKTEIRLLSDVIAAVKAVSYISAHQVNTLRSLQSKEQLLLLLLENEQQRLTVWVYPLTEPSKIAGTAAHPKGGLEFPRIHKEVRWLLLNFPSKAIDEPEALTVLLGGSLPADVSFQLKYLIFWAPVNPITAVTYFLPQYQNHPCLIQYAMRAVESHSVDVTFFYVPQIVQTLRYDALGYVERYILETAQFSQLFAHQIIWNMKANSYKDDDAQIPDDIKPTLDKVMDRMVESFLPHDREFYLREFAFFDEVTGISGKLKPLIKRSKPEKKQKIEEELRKIKVEVGVYLPSNPDGVVIGIDRKSGKPLQSHAKAPYMATFRIKKNKGGVEETEEVVQETAAHHGEAPTQNTIEVWQSAIFKVGDDCRQDVLALQMIAAFRGIFHNVGLDVYVFPYRVTATAPGCGVIDVLPNSISRDMLGREAVNGLYEYFISKYGNEDSLRFQQARNNFVKSMAAYSIISFLLQFKDRHNGNIMVDDAGHILHIDFGFIFDIAPGGIKFERAPFKLTSEMVAVMGGSAEHQSFKWFEELCIKAFLASRQHIEKLSQIVLLMMDSGLPCFKPETVKHFKERFVLEKTEREAADFVKMLIRKSYSSYSTGVYDQFQLMTNGIPY
ncbi:putative phosphatidylinositol 4-kinase protein [Phaeoacremonium minimum UCRPA7]|uniref:1-phosphatidylinositol 4-kinase n=1 Tax=Phaeoacremonium minimum (strain UCR-PA7) TaxID=1286976 RepID=R8BCA6_PHAM7|nr:putative phosphatidylinositol 4-kinase protein [Phaeoacremonium minimum UCRPA7]EON96933.1 putative phosphatidylinositol 4-kinase protein [Phaeoacremonium minimum UCRPA7]